MSGAMNERYRIHSSFNQIPPGGAEDDPVCDPEIHVFCCIGHSAAFEHC